MQFSNFECSFRVLLDEKHSKLETRNSKLEIMRIIAGTLRRRLIKAPKGLITRPTTDRVRESLFNLVVNRMDLEDAHVLDLFAGTGSLGFEAISRGATAVTFVEENGRVLKCCRENAALLGVEEACTFFQADAVQFLRTYGGPAFDLILADPPYELDALPRLPETAGALLAPHGLFVLEHDARHRFDDHPHLDTSRPYGRTIVSVFRTEQT